MRIIIKKMIKWNNFNPFEKKSSSSSMQQVEQRIKSTIFISPRKKQMDSIVMELYRNNHDDALMYDILIQNEEFLLEPFLNENFEPDFEPDSIYEEGMTSDEKITKYSNVMLDRINNAKSGEVKIVLRAMMEFVLDKVPSSTTN